MADEQTIYRSIYAGEEIDEAVGIVRSGVTMSETQTFEDTWLNRAVNTNGTLRTTTTYRTMWFNIPAGATRVTVTGSNSTSSTAQAIGFLSFEDENETLTVAKTIAADDTETYTVTVAIPANAVKVVVCVTYDFLIDSGLTVTTYPVTFPSVVNVDTAIRDINDKLKSAITCTIPVSYGGFSVGTSALDDAESTVRARTPICDVAVYGSVIEVIFPDTLAIQYLAVYSNGEWSTISATNAGVYEIPAGATRYRLSWRNRASGTTPITEEELAGIVVKSTQQVLLAAIADKISWYNGKIYAALGDSITYGFIPRNSPGYPGRLSSYAARTAEKLGMQLKNYGVSGSSLAYIESRQPMCRRYSAMIDSADVITFMGGTNDIRNGIELGTMSDRSDATYYGALHVLMGGIVKKYRIDQGTEVGKTKKIVALTPIKLLESSAPEIGGTGTLVDFEPWVEAVKEVAAYYSIPCLDFYNLSGINPHLNQTVQGTETGYTGFYNPYITDGTHPTQDGADMMADVLCGFLRTLT